MPELLIGREYADVLIKSIDDAKVSIRILAYDWRWYSTQIGSRIQKFNRAIVAAKRRGVNIEVVLNSQGISRTLKSLGIKVFVTNSSRKMHIKLVLIDEKIAIIGSHNLTISGFELNHEMSIVVDSPHVVDRCIQFFKNVCLS